MRSDIGDVFSQISNGAQRTSNLLWRPSPRQRLFPRENVKGPASSRTASSEATARKLPALAGEM